MILQGELVVYTFPLISILFPKYNKISCCHLTQNKSQTQCARAYEVTSFLCTDCELSTETSSEIVDGIGPWSFLLVLQLASNDS